MRRAMLEMVNSHKNTTKRRIVSKSLFSFLGIIAIFMTSFVSLSPAHAVPTISTAPTKCTIKSGEVFFKHRGQNRTVRYFVPAGATSATPTIVSLHGAGGGTTAGFENGTQFSVLGKRNNFIAVYPQARSETHSSVWDVRVGGEDASLIGSIATALHSSGCSSPKNTYVNGFSMGAMLTSRVMCERGQLFAGATMIGGVLPPTPKCRVAPNKPILIMHGFQDTVVFWYGGLVPAVQTATGPWAVFPYDRGVMAKQWAATKGCNSSGKRTQAGNTITVDFRCNGGATTKVMLFLTGGHDWTFPDKRIVTSQFILWNMGLRSVSTQW